MSTRGPKARTGRNAAPQHKELIRHESLDPPCTLTDAAKAEYERLLGVLRTKGTLDRVDLGVVSECARVKDLLDRSYPAATEKPDMLTIRLVAMLTSQRRGMLRELGLTTAPCRSVVKTNPVPAEDDPVAGLIKLSG